MRPTIDVVVLVQSLNPRFFVLPPNKFGTSLYVDDFAHPNLWILWFVTCIEKGEEYLFSKIDVDQWPFSRRLKLKFE